MAATGAFLRRISRISKVYCNRLLLSFVNQIGFKPRKTPGVYPSPDFFSDLNPIPDIRQFFHRNNRTNGSRIYDSFRDNVIAIVAEAVNLATKLGQMSLSRFGAFRLKSAFKAKISVLNLFSVSCTKYLAVLVDAKIGTTDFPIFLRRIIFRKRKSNLLSSIQRQKRSCSSTPLILFCPQPTLATRLKDSVNFVTVARSAVDCSSVTASLIFNVMVVIRKCYGCTIAMSTIIGG